MWERSSRLDPHSGDDDSVDDDMIVYYCPHVWYATGDDYDPHCMTKSGDRTSEG